MYSRIKLSLHSEILVKSTKESTLLKRKIVCTVCVEICTHECSYQRGQERALGWLDMDAGN